MTLIFVVVLLGLCGVSYGVDMSILQPYDLYANYMFLSEDTNADGILTMEELHQLFDRYDANGNGAETRHEYTTYICSVNPALYQISHYLYDDWDVDNDHTLRVNDYDALFAKMDISPKNGQVQDSEFITYFVALFTSIEGQSNHVHGNSHEHGAASCHV